MTEKVARVSVPEQVVLRPLGEEAVVLHLDTGRYHGLDPVATRMWAALAEAGSVEGAVALLVDEYDVGRERLREDLDELVEGLVERRLLRVVFPGDDRS